MSTNNGGPAFPCEGYTTNDGNRPFDGLSGMTLRDYFAAKAMQALLPLYDANPNFDLANAAYGSADAMLRAREE
jgi:hypothetical protein